MSNSEIRKKIISFNFMLLIIISSLTGIFLIDNVSKIVRVKADSTWELTTDSDFKNGILEDVEINGIGSEAELRLKYYYGWVEKTPNIRPPYRSVSAMTSIWGVDKVILFGGSSNDKIDDTWVYDFSDNSWTNKTSGNRPSARGAHELSAIWGTDKVLLYGGGNTLNDTWVYDLSDNLWISKDPQNSPGDRRDHQMAPIFGTDKVLFFGGRIWNEGWGYNDTWVYDLSENEWTQLNPLNSPSPRFWHVMTPIYNNDKFVLFGGTDDDPLIEYNDTWVYDYSNNNWVNMNPSGEIPNNNTGCEMENIYGTDKAVLFTGIRMKNETFVYDLSKNNWIRENFTNKCKFRYSHTMASIYGTDKIMLFGGWNHSKLLNDTWIYKYSGYIEKGTYISPPFKIKPQSLFKSISWNSKINRYTSIKFQLRSGPTKDNMRSKDFIGPDGSELTYYTSTPSQIWQGHNNDSWIQVKTFLESTNYYETPILKDFTIKYNSYPKLIPQPVIPLYGNIESEFNFTVKYLDKDNDKPLFIKIIIDNISHDVTENDASDVTYFDGKNYWYRTKLKAGNHTYQFFSSDGEFNCGTIPKNVSVDVGPVNRIVVEPSNITLKIDEFQQFTSKCFDADNNSLSITPFWSANGGGIIDQNGNFTAKSVGTWFVFANHSFISGNAAINILDDSDDDGMPDDWEKKYGLNFTDPKDALLDFDQDNLTNLEEYLNNTDPTNPDTDNDTLLDGDEIKIYNTDPLNPDSDTDGQDDGKEIENDTDPLDDKEPDKEEENKSSEQKNDYLIYIISGIIIIIILIIAAFYLIVKWKKK